MTSAAMASGLALLFLAAVATPAPHWHAAPTTETLRVSLPRHQDLLVPLPGQRLLMHTSLLLPQGKGPFPLAVVNHGSTESSYVRARWRMPSYPLLTRWLLKQGFAVALPLRPGHGITGGPYFEDQGRCDNADYKTSGLKTAYSIEAAIDYLTRLAYVQRQGVVVVGQSAGGWGALALASRNPQKVRAVINFAGGRGGHADDRPDHNCVPTHLIRAAGAFGHTARVPTLWLYGENDTFFAPDLSEPMFAAFRKAGGKGEFHLLAKFGPEGHAAISSPAAFAQWEPMVAHFLAAHP